MTAPGDFSFVDASGVPPAPSNVALEPETTTQSAPPPTPKGAFPPEPVLKMDEETETQFLAWLDTWLLEMVTDQNPLQDKWAKYEAAYRAKDDNISSFPPFKGACTDVIPLIAMGVDPVHARLDTGIFKQNPVFTLTALRKDMATFTPSMSAFIDYYQRHKLKLRKVASPRTLECTKLGTCVYKVAYDKEVIKGKTYDENYKVVDRSDVVFAGPRVFGIQLGDILFPPDYTDVQLMPIIAERQRTTWEQLKIQELSGKLKNVDKLKNWQLQANRTPLEKAREDASDHAPSTRVQEVVVYEIWCDYDIDGDGIPEKIIATYHYDTRTLIQLRYNWYFHQRKPFVFIPYMVTNDSVLGIGLCEMLLPFQLAITRFHRMAQDNAYIANIRMFIAKRGCGIEEVPRLYAGRVFFVDDPGKDFIPFQVGDIYPSTLAERNNLVGMGEKRSGISDYLTGRESPVVGSRATATSTIALIQQGEARVEETLENQRNGFSEILEYCISIWIQYGTGGLEDLVFADDKIAQDVKQFFKMVTHQNVNGLFGFELTATDASTTRVSQQQMQLAIIQVMMQYLEKLLAAGQGALQAMQTMPVMTEMIKDVMAAARAMFRDLLNKYDIRNAEEYLPDLEKYLNGAATGQPAAGPAAVGGAPGGASGVETPSGLPIGNGPSRAAVVPAPARPGIGYESRVLQNISGGGAGT